MRSASRCETADAGMHQLLQGKSALRVSTVVEKVSRTCERAAPLMGPGLTTTLPKTSVSSRPRKRIDGERSNARSAIGRRAGEVARTPGGACGRVGAMIIGIWAGGL